MGRANASAGLRSRYRRFAASFRGAGHEVVLIEKAPSVRGEGYTIDFFGAGYDVAAKLGLIPKLEQMHYPVSAVAYVRDNGSEKFPLAYPLLRERIFRGPAFQLYARLARAGPV